MFNWSLKGGFKHRTHGDPWATDVVIVALGWNWVNRIGCNVCFRRWLCVFGQHKFVWKMLGDDEFHGEQGLFRDLSVTEQKR